MKDTTTTGSTNPRWWTDDTTSAWDRVKEAMRRDWEQTKRDFSTKHGQNLDQDVDDTVKQMVGSQPIPPRNQPNPDATTTEQWETVEPAMRYGYGARSHHKEYTTWDDRAESRLREEWNDLRTGRTWDEVKSHVRRGWESVKR